MSCVGTQYTSLRRTARVWTVGIHDGSDLPSTKQNLTALAGDTTDGNHALPVPLSLYAYFETGGNWATNMLRFSHCCVFHR